MGPDYVHEDSLRLERRLDELNQLRKRAQDEADHARSLGLDMQGPVLAAKAEVERLSRQIVHLERVVERARAGFPYFERQGFEDAIDAVGESSRWQRLSEIPTPGAIFGHDDAVVRLPIEIQKQYAQAVFLRLFEGFEVCECFEYDIPVGQGDSTERTTLRYLFGTIQSPMEEDEGKALFLIAQWKNSLP